MRLSVVQTCQRQLYYSSGPLAASASLRIRNGFGPVCPLRFRMAHGFLQVHPPDSEVYRIGDRMQHRLEGLAKGGGTQLRFRNAGGYYSMRGFPPSGDLSGAQHLSVTGIKVDPYA